MRSPLRFKFEGSREICLREFISTENSGAFGTTVLVNKKLITQIEPKAFTIGHELKHHLMDEVQGVSFCSADNEQITLERTADAFAAELLFPSKIFLEHMATRVP